MSSDRMAPGVVIVPDSIHREKSELYRTTVGPSDHRGTVRYREVTFDDLFREKFIPLDCTKKVGNYVIGHTIGEGSFSKVRQAKHVLTGEKHAIKVMPKKTSLIQYDVRRRFHREVTSLRQITHKNIVQLYEGMETSRNYYIVLQFISGDNFKEYLNKRGRLEEHEAKHYMGQLADAICYMHSRAVVHRDLKPENLLLDKDQIKIIDFGLSAYLSDTDTMSTQCGSPAYAAPEIFTKQPYTQQVDVWSTGVILYLAVTGNLPFSTHGRSSAHQYSAVLQGYTLPQGVQLSCDCRDVIAAMLKMEPAERVSSSDLIHHSWFQAPTDPNR